MADITAPVINFGKEWNAGVFVYQTPFLKKKSILSRYPKSRNAFIKDLKLVKKGHEYPKRDYVDVLEAYNLLNSKEAAHLREHWFTTGLAKWFPNQAGQDIEAKMLQGTLDALKYGKEVCKSVEFYWAIPQDIPDPLHVSRKKEKNLQFPIPLPVYIETDHEIIAVKTTPLPIKEEEEEDLRAVSKPTMHIRRSGMLESMSYFSRYLKDHEGFIEEIKKVDNSNTSEDYAAFLLKNKIIDKGEADYLRKNWFTVNESSKSFPHELGSNVADRLQINTMYAFEAARKSNKPIEFIWVMPVANEDYTDADNLQFPIPQSNPIENDHSIVSFMITPQPVNGFYVPR